MSQQPIVFLDTETTGVHPEREVWEVAMIRRDQAGERETSFFVHGVDLSKADPFGLRIGRFYDRHPDYRTGTKGQRHTGEETARLVEHWTRDALIVGAVPNFDTEVLSVLLRRHGLIPSWHYHLIDVEALAVGYLHGKVLDAQWLGQKWESDKIGAALGIDPTPEDERHTALGDARWVMRWYDRIAEGNA